jgi:hypothetical protein
MYGVRSGSAPFLRTLPNPFVHVLKFRNDSVRPELILIGIIPFTNRGSSRGGTVSQIDADAASECKGVIVIGAIGRYAVDIKDVNLFALGVTQRVAKRI